MFKSGDRVRVLRHRNFFGEDVPGYGIPNGTIVTLRELDHELNGDGFVMFAVEGMGDGYSWLIHSDDIELVNEGPVRIVTRREIVPGVYGRVKVMSDGFHAVNIGVTESGRVWSAEELREAAHVLNQIAEAWNDA